MSLGSGCESDLLPAPAPPPPPLTLHLHTPSTCAPLAPASCPLAGVAAEDPPVHCSWSLHPRSPLRAAAKWPLLSLRPAGTNPPVRGWAAAAVPATSAVKQSIGSTTGCTITEKAPTRAFSWLKLPTSAFTFKTLLRHYATQVLTPRSLKVKLGLRQGLVAIRHYSNQTARLL